MPDSIHDKAMNAAASLILTLANKAGMNPPDVPTAKKVQTLLAGALQAFFDEGVERAATTLEEKKAIIHDATGLDENGLAWAKGAAMRYIKAVRDLKTPTGIH